MSVLRMPGSWDEKKEKWIRVFEDLRQQALELLAHNDMDRHRVNVDFDRIEKAVFETGEWISRYSRAAEAGNTQAQYRVGSFFLDDRDGVYDYGEAVRLFRLATAKGSMEARQNLSGIKVSDVLSPVNFSEPTGL